MERNRSLVQDLEAQPAPQPAPEPIEPPAAEKIEPIVSGPKVGRNDDCPCGSGKKNKKCCGTLEEPTT